MKVSRRFHESSFKSLSQPQFSTSKNHCKGLASAKQRLGFNQKHNSQCGCHNSASPIIIRNIEHSVASDRCKVKLADANNFTTFKSFKTVLRVIYWRRCWGTNKKKHVNDKPNFKSRYATASRVISLVRKKLYSMSLVLCHGNSVTKAFTVRDWLF